MKSGGQSVILRSLEEHKHLNKKLSEVQKLGQEFWDARCGITDLLVKLETQLEELTPMMEHHFAQEETGGLHEEIVDALPNESRRVTMLFEEHRALLRILGEVRGVTAVLRAMVQTEQPMLFDRINKALQQLQRHETEEHTLFMRALEGEGPAPD
jgi:hypothetical protein